MLSSKRGKLYLKFIAAVAILAAIYSLAALAANLSIIPGIITSLNATGFQTSENVSVALQGEHFGCWSKIVNERVRTK